MRLAHVLVCHSVVPRKLFSSIPIVADSKWYIVLHSANEEIELLVRRMMIERNCVLLPYRANRGLARSWNEAIDLAVKDDCDSFLILNDDLFFYDNSYEYFRDTIESVCGDPDVAYITTRGRETGVSPHNGEINVQSFACCSLTKSVLNRVGYFDENFYPAYFEDVDYGRRVALSGMRVHVDDRILVEHERSSTTWLMSDEERRSMQWSYRLNEEYYSRKWGFEQDHYDRPFNSASFDLKIRFVSRNSPYGDPHDRKDRPIDDAKFYVKSARLPG